MESTRMCVTGMCLKGRGSVPAGKSEARSASCGWHITQLLAAPIATRAVLFAVAAIISGALVGCGPGTEPSDVDLSVFQDDAGPVQLDESSRHVLRAGRVAGPYRLVAGDHVEFQMPAVVRLMPNREGDQTKPYQCRVDSAGRIVLPIIGEVKVAGKTLSQVETAVAKGYYPKYLRQEPSIVVSVVEHRLSSISIVGAIRTPGTYELRSNEMMLVAALMKAGGIAARGAKSIRIDGRPSAEAERPLTISVQDGNIPVRDVKLNHGDTIIVDAMETQSISVVGLVKHPGMFPWDPRGRCTVMDALAFAGGVNDLADPQYARVYRQDSDGKLISALLKLQGSSAVGASQIYLKAGDIVVVEQTPRTRTRLLLSQIIRMGVGVDAGATIGP